MVLLCTTLARVQALIPRTDAASDAVLTTLIASVSKRFQQATYRHLDAIERTEIYPLKPHARVISLRGAPCYVVDVRGVSVSTFEVKLSASQSFSASTTLTRNTDYVIEQDAGLLRVLATLDAFTGPMGRAISPAYVQVKYTGGLADDTTDLIADYPDIADACDKQVVYEWRRRTEAGAGDQHIGDSTTTHTADVGLLAGVKTVLERYKRRGG